MPITAVMTMIKKRISGVNHPAHYFRRAGLPAGGGKKRFSMPYDDNLLIKGIHTSEPTSRALLPGQTPIYSAAN